MATLSDQEKVELEDFISQQDFNPAEYDKNSSIKSNLMIIGRNWNTAKTFLSDFKKYFGYLKRMIDTDNIVESALISIRSNKLVFSLPYDLIAGNSESFEIDNNLYLVERIDTNTFKITCQNIVDWFVDALIIQVKNSTGVIIFPTIKTFSNEITINFAYEITEDYAVYIL